MQLQFCKLMMLGCFVLVCSLAQSAQIEYTFTEGPPVVPSDVSLAGTETDWTLEPNRDNVDATLTALDFSGGFLRFIDDASNAGNLGLMTIENAALRDEYPIAGVGESLWIVADYQMHEYGYREDGSINTVDQSRAQLFWLSFLNSAGTGFGLSLVAGNYNSEGNVYFTAIGDGNRSQDIYRTEGYLIEEGDSPNLNRRTLILRVTETPFDNFVIVDAKFDDGHYQRISSFYNEAISAYPSGNGTGDENVLLSIGNYSGSGAIDFDLHRLALTNEDPDPSATGGDEPIAIRQLSANSMAPGGGITVSVQVFNPASSAQEINVVENIAEGFSAANVSHGGNFVDGTVSWNVSVEPGVTLLTYRYEAPEEVDGVPSLSGTINDFAIGGDSTISVRRARTPAITAWNPPEAGWDYIYDPDLGSPEDIASDGWAHNNGSDEYAFQPVLPEESENAGEVWQNIAFIDDEDFGGQALRIYDPGNPIEMPEYMTTDPGSSRKITLNYDLGNVTQAVAAFRVRTREFVDQFGVTIPFGYPDADQYPLLGLNHNVTATGWDDYANLAGSGLFFDPFYPDTLNFPYSDILEGPRIPGSSEFNWDHTEWHEYWITWNIAEGEKATALYVDGELQPMFSYPLSSDHPFYEDSDDFRAAQEQGAFFNRSREADADIPEGNAVFRITFRNTGDAGTLEFDYIALAAGTDEPPQEFVGVSNWSLY